jgi:predicted RND superfamily exporter protein
MGVAPSSAPESSVPVLAQTTIIGIAVAAIVSVVLLAVVIIAVAAVYGFRKRKQSKAEGASVNYVEVPVEDGSSLSSKWQQMKVNTRGDYEVLPTSFSKENSDASTHSV